MVADISIATTVAEGTIKNAYRDLYPHAARIIPEWYAKERDLKNLSSPKAWVNVFCIPKRATVLSPTSVLLDS